MMPGLTLDTNGAPAHPSSSSTSASQPRNPNPIPSVTPVPIPQVPSQTQSQLRPQPTPSSPPRPTYSPITPPLNPVALPAPPPRPLYTHTSHQDAASAPAPAPVPLDFDANPDVLALKSAISILQLQRRRAEADMAALARAKAAAAAEPDAFARDLAAGRVRVGGDGLFGGGLQGSGMDDDNNNDSDSDSSSDADMEEEEEKPVTGSSQTPIKTEAGQDIDMTGDDTANVGSADQNEATEGKDGVGVASQQKQKKKKQKKEEPRPWAKLPAPQSVVRCPPLNWANYAVVGESLDKLHNEQLARPTQGVPATVSVAPDGRYEFKEGGDGRRETLVGVAAPYAPLRDRLDKKPRGGGPRR